MKEVEEAILLKNNYAFETNFSSDLPFRLIEDFKNANFKVTFLVGTVCRKMLLNITLRKA